MSILLALMSVYYMPVQYPQGPEESIRPSGNRVIDCYEPLCGFLKSNPGSLEEQKCFYTLSSPKLQGLSLS